jgi:chemotaxis response regulator CheB
LKKIRVLILFGMPKEAMKLGAVDRVVGLDCISRTVLDHV